jgi:hypothetical protein
VYYAWQKNNNNSATNNPNDANNFYTNNTNSETNQTDTNSNTLITPNGPEVKESPPYSGDICGSVFFTSEDSAHQADFIKNTSCMAKAILNCSPATLTVGNKNAPDRFDVIRRDANKNCIVVHTSGNYYASNNYKENPTSHGPVICQMSQSYINSNKIDPQDPGVGGIVFFMFHATQGVYTVNGQDHGFFESGGGPTCRKG